MQTNLAGGFIMKGKVVAKEHKGFSLMELTIVLALLAIIAAIIIPMFLITTDRARLRGDIQSARVIQNAIDLYRIERGRNVQGATVAAMVQNLATAGYLDARNTEVQTQDAVWQRVPNTPSGVIMVNIAASPDNVHQIYSNLPANERQLVTGGRLAP